MMVVRNTFVVVLGLVVAATSSALAADDYSAPIQPASNEGELAMSSFKVPEGVRVELFAAEPLLANPVAFAIDARGRVYVCETFRQGKGVEDNRNHMNWLEADLSLRTVEERRAMFQQFMGESVAEWGREQDRIRLLEDTNGDGRADIDAVFADGFHDVVEGTGAGVLAHDGTVYYTCIPRVWSFRDTDGDNVADQKTPLHDGFGVRVAFRGHDMHGLVLGYDGRVYFSIGDRGYNVTTPEGNRFDRPDTGAVFRCELDGSNLEEFAYGLRNPQELAFDDYGNLFTGDNNSDGGDRARWVHVVQGGDTGWRMYYQYLPDRGPWNRERIWYPFQSDDETTRVQPAYTLPPISNLGDGPSGLVAYPGVGLPERYQSHFFLADFRGQASQSGIRAFTMTPQGASFALADSHWYLQNLLATDVDFGYDGKLYVSDWVDGWNGPGKGRIYTFTDESQREAVRQAGVAAMMAEGFADRSDADLAALLDHPDRRVRQAAQLALADRNATAVLMEVARRPDQSLARYHAVWALGQIGRRQPQAGVDSLLVELSNAPDAEMRAQVARTLGELYQPDDAAAVRFLQSSVTGGTARNQYFAAIALGRSRDVRSREVLIKLLAMNGDRDPVLRHAAAVGLAGCSTPEELLTVEESYPAAVRLGLVLALRRMRSGAVATFLNDDEPRIVEEAARAIHDLPIAEGLPHLARLAERDPAGMSDLLARRVLNANYRLGAAEHAALVAKFAQTPMLAEHLRQEALFCLTHWDQVPVLDRVTNEYRPLPARPLDAAREAVQSVLEPLLAGDDPLRTEAVSLVSKYRLTGADDRLYQFLQETGEADGLRAASLSALAAVDSPLLDRAIRIALAANGPQTRVAAYEVLAQRDPEQAAGELQRALDSELATLGEQQAAVRILAATDHPATRKVLEGWIDLLRQLPERVPPGLRLDLQLAAEATSERAIADAGDSPAEITNEWLLSRYRYCTEGGDAARGKALFFGSAAASCRRCHKVNGEGSSVGPDLSGIGKEKDRAYLLESLILPNEKIAKGFETAVFILDDGRVVSGIVKGEDESIIQIVTPQGEPIRIEKASVEEQAVGRSGMPEDLFKSLAPGDVRDLVEYLSTLQSPAADSDAHGHE